MFELSCFLLVRKCCSNVTLVQSTVYNRGADVVEQYDKYVTTVLTTLFEGVTNTLSFVGRFPSRSCSLCLPILWEIYIYAAIEIERFSIGNAVLPWQPFIMEYGSAVLPGDL